LSVCRFSDGSDVYVYYSVYGGLECCGCRLAGGAAFNAADEQSMIAHLEKHIAAGHKVPDQAVEELVNPLVRGN